MYELGGKGAGSVVAGGVITAVVLPLTGGTDSVVAVAAAVLSGLVVWGLSYSLFSR